MIPTYVFIFLNKFTEKYIFATKNLHILQIARACVIEWLKLLTRTDHTSNTTDGGSHTQCPLHVFRCSDT